MSGFPVKAESLVSFKNSQGEVLIANMRKLSHSKIILEIYSPDSIVQLSEVLQSLRICWGEKVLYDGRAVIFDLVDTGLTVLASASLVDSWKEMPGLTKNRQLFESHIGQMVESCKKFQAIQEGYRLRVDELRAFLDGLSRWLGQLFVHHNMGTTNQAVKLDSKSFSELEKPILKKLRSLFLKFEAEAAKVPAEELEFHKEFVRRNLHQYMLLSPFFHRSFYKPLGYAGDYEMVNMMVRDRQAGPNVHSQLINSYFFMIGPTRAHRNRIDILLENIITVAKKAKAQGKVAKILNVGCGPVLEIQRFIKETDLVGYVDFTLLDFNRETVEYAQSTISKLLYESELTDDNFHYIQQSVHNLIKESVESDKNETAADYDFIYCAGLYDYLSDKVCLKLLKLFYKKINSGGKILVTNVHPDNESKYVMEHIVEWYLVYRDEKDMLQLGESVGPSEIFSDATGLNVFLEVHNKE